MDAKYQLIRAKLPSRKMFFRHIQALTCYLCFENFGALLDFMIRGLRIDIPDSSLDEKPVADFLRATAEPGAA